MWYQVFPLLLVILSNLFYHILAKQVSPEANPFLSLLATYCVAACLSLALFFATAEQKNIVQAFGRLNWVSFALGCAIVGLEAGYILLYRAGWAISVGSLVANITVAVLLLVVGILFFKEVLGAHQAIGIVLCLMGLGFINWH